MPRGSEGEPVRLDSVSDEFRAQVHEWVVRTCQEQGVPVKITDPGVIRKVEAIVNQAREEREGTQPAQGA